MNSPRSSACHPLAEEFCLHHYSPALPSSPAHHKEVFENSVIRITLAVGRALYCPGEQEVGVQIFSSWRNGKKQVCDSCAWALTRVKVRLDGAATSFGWEIRNKLKCAVSPLLKRLML